VSGGVWGGRPPEEAPEADGVAPDALRELVREVLRDVLPGLAGRPGSPPPAVPSAPPASGPAAPAAPPTSDPGPPRLTGATGAGGPARAAGGWEAVSRPGLEVRPARLATDEELHEFVLQVIALADNPKRRRDLLAGRLRFTLALAGAPEGPADHRIDKGAVTERAVQAAASAGARLILGPRAVLTPLARDRARALGVPIEKER
jgi:hypothetical protein